MAYGCTGKILRVDLTERKISVEEPEEALYRKYLGGTALAAHYLLTELKPGVDPLGPENVLIFMASVLTGNPGPGLSRFTVAAKSPVTGGFGEGEAGGWWGPELKFAGYDGIIFTGKADKPVYLWIKDGVAEIRDAQQLWGKDTGDVEAAIREELGDSKIRVAQIGQAGENLIKFACVLNELKHSNGRTGMGAVMGSKNLRAIAVRGTGKPALFDEKAVKEVRSQILANYKQTPGDMHDLGTSGGVGFLNKRGILPTRNFQQGAFEEYDAITGKTMRDTIMTGRGTCYACPVACKREVEVKEGPYQVTPLYGGPEYETIGSLGSLCGIGNLAAISKGNELCNRYGLDTISAGTVIAWAMECYEKGVLTKEDTGGVELRFGDADVMLQMLNDMTFRKGFGDVLAEGSLKAARKLGKGEEFVVHCKGQDWPMHEARGKRGTGFSYAISPVGADHMRAPHDTDYEAAGGPALSVVEPMVVLDPVSALDMGPDKIRAIGPMIDVWTLYNCAGVCQFVGEPIGPITLQMLVDYVAAVTGWKTSLYDLIKVAQRSQNMERLFNYREGFTAADDAMPPRAYEPLQNGALEGEAWDKAEFEASKKLYYEMVGWDPITGMPTEGKLNELGLLWAVR